MATTEQPRTACRDQPPAVRRYVKSLEELIERFHDPHTSLEECYGLISRLAIWCEDEAWQPQNAIAAAVFLMEIGSEREPRHPSTVNHSDLRRRARIVLARNICRQLWIQCEWPGRDVPRGHEAINQLTAFYVEHEGHADLNARDLAIIHEFLEHAVRDANQRIHHGDAVRALVATGAWKAIMKHRLFEAIPWLCARLAAAFGRPEPMLTARLWWTMLGGKDPDDFKGRITQAGLTADDLIAFSEEIRRVVALCGMAIGHHPDDDDDAEREAAKVLLQLVSLINHAVVELRG